MSEVGVTENSTAAAPAAAAAAEGPAGTWSPFLILSQPPSFTPGSTPPAFLFAAERPEGENAAAQQQSSHIKGTLFRLPPISLNGQTSSQPQMHCPLPHAPFPAVHALPMAQPQMMMHHTTTSVAPPQQPVAQTMAPPPQSQQFGGAIFQPLPPMFSQNLPTPPVPSSAVTTQLYRSGFVGNAQQAAAAAQLLGLGTPVPPPASESAQQQQQPPSGWNGPFVLNPTPGGGAQLLSGAAAQAIVSAAGITGPNMPPTTVQARVVSQQRPAQQQQPRAPEALATNVQIEVEGNPDMRGFPTFMSSIGPVGVMPVAALSAAMAARARRQREVESTATAANAPEEDCEWASVASGELGAHRNRGGSAERPLPPLPSHFTTAAPAAAAPAAAESAAPATAESGANQKPSGATEAAPAGADASNATIQHSETTSTSSAAAGAPPAPAQADKESCECAAAGGRPHTQPPTASRAEEKSSTGAAVVRAPGDKGLEMLPAHVRACYDRWSSNNGAVTRQMMLEAKCAQRGFSESYREGSAGFSSHSAKPIGDAALALLWRQTASRVNADPNLPPPSDLTGAFCHSMLRTIKASLEKDVDFDSANYPNLHRLQSLDL